MDLIIQDLCKAYYGQSVLQDFSYCFPEGKTTCIMGRSGCGKTTLLNLILGLELPDTGTIQGNKEPMAAVFQEDRLCRNLTVQANIRLVNKRLSDKRIWELLAAVDLEEAWDKKAGELSGGMCRRTAIARALAADRNCILMDEPLSGLDPDTRIKVLDTIKKYTKGKTLLLVTHEKQDAFSLGADKILEM